MIVFLDRLRHGARVTCLVILNRPYAAFFLNETTTFALFTNPPLAGVASLSFQYWRIANVIVGSYLLLINSMTLYSIWNMIYNLISE